MMKSLSISKSWFRSWWSAVALVLLVTPALAAPPASAYSLTDLGTLGGGYSTAADINNRGEVAGTSTTATGESHAFVWRAPHGMTDLGGLGGDYSTARGINDHGWVVGQTQTPDDQLHAFVWHPQSGMIDLGTLGGRFSIAEDINNRGHVVGVSETVDGQFHAFLWEQRNGMIDLGTLGGHGSWGTTINDQGDVVGRSSVSLPNDHDPFPDEHAFLWSARAGMVDLDTFGGDYSIAQDINNRRQVVGQSVRTGGSAHAFIWSRATGMIDLGSLGGTITYSAAIAINDRSQVIGWTDTSPIGDSHEFLWNVKDGMIIIETIANNGVLSVTAMNDRGQIAGDQIIPQGADSTMHAAILSPRHQ